MSNKGLFTVIGLFLVVVVLVLSVVIVPAGNVKVVTRLGAINRVAYQGMSFKVPLIEGTHKMNIRTQKDEVDAASASSDLQVVTAVIAVNYHLDGQYASWVFEKVGKNYQELVVAPAIQNVFKAVTAQYKAAELIQKREEVRLKAEAELQKQLSSYHLVVENFNITNFDFSPEYNAAIEAKQVAEQNVQTAEQNLKKAQVEAKTRVVEAQAQADSQKALKDTGSLTPEYIQYLFLTKWNGVLPQVTGGADAVFDIKDYVGSVQPK